MAYEGLKDNKNAEKWDLEASEKLMKEALELSISEDYDFIGEIAKKLNTYIDVFDYLVEKFPQLKKYKTHIKRNCEANCFSNIKNNHINTGAGIMNLKSNHGWTDRVETDHKTNGKEMNTNIISFIKTDD